MELLVKKLNEKARLPERVHYNDAGLDLFSVEEVTLAPGERKALGTGIAMALPPECVGLIWDTSSVPFKYGVKTMGGVVDAQYRGEVKVLMVNLSSEKVTFVAGQKLAQMVIQKVEFFPVKEVEGLDETERGDRGFGKSKTIE